MHVNVDALRPHAECRDLVTLCCFSDQKRGVSFIQLPPRYLSSPSVPVPFSFFEYEEK